MRLKVITAVMVVVSSVATSSAKKVRPPNDLAVEIASVQWNNTGYGTQWFGHGNIREAGQRHGFDFVFTCEPPFMATNGNGFYPAHWKKQGLRIVIEESDFGNPEKKHYCELKTALRPYTYEPNYTSLTTRPVVR